jgi:glycosyltransferase involved in cell wall biosynthesis
MRILLAANSTWNIVNFRMPVIDALLIEGHHITILAPADQYVGHLREIPNLEFESINALDRKSIDLISNIQLVYELFQTYRRLKPDLIIHYTVKPNIFGNIAAWFLGIASICVITGLGYAFLNNGIAQMATRRLYRFSMRKAQEVIFENESDLRLFRKYGYLKAKQGVSVPGCGVDITHFSPREIAKEHDGQVIFTFIGRLLKDKGILEYVEAASLVHERYPNTLFRIVGNLDEDNPAHISPKSLGDWRRLPGVEYLGFSDDIRPLLAETDWVVLPSYREGMSRVLLEALAMARPIITTDTPGCREAVQPGKNGYLIPIKNAKALAIACETAANMSKQEWYAFSMNSRRKAVLEFESSLIGAFYTQIIQRLASQKPIKIKDKSNKI